MSPSPPPAAEQAQLRALNLAVERADLPLESLWLRYFALGGTAGPLEVEAHLQSLMVLPPLQCDVLAQAVNERLDELDWTSRIPYLGASPAHLTSGPLTALVTLLPGYRTAPPELLPAVAAAAAEALGVHVVIYLADDTQRRLVPVPTTGAQDRAVLAVDGTLAGRAYRTLEMLPERPPADGRADNGADPGDGERLWVPLLDGAARLGVLDVAASPALDLDDPDRRAQCGWLAAALGSLLTAARGRGAGLTVPADGRAPDPAHELIRRLLPPLTASTDTITVSGVVLPGDQVSGDAFDYDLSAARATFAVFDGVGIGRGAELVTAVALAAYRAAGRDATGLLGRARAVDEALAARFAGVPLAGVLAELDLATGALRYLAAGDVYPILLRGGTAGARLTGGRFAPFGSLAAAAVAARGAAEAEPVGVAWLRPGDLVVLHTDGVTGACDRAGIAFGADRLTGLLASGGADLLPEVARRVAAAVADHRGDAPADDATVLLATWSGEHALHAQLATT